MDIVPGHWRQKMEGHWGIGIERVQLGWLFQPTGTRWKSRKLLNIDYERWTDQNHALPTATTGFMIAVVLYCFSLFVL